jgi:hypothetical protein
MAFEKLVVKSAMIAGQGNPDFAIVIGIDHYDHHELDALPGARKDAKEFIDWLKKGHSEGQFKDRRIIERLDQPTYSDIKRAFDELCDYTENVKGKRLYIFISGHGFGEGVNDTGMYTSEHSRHGDAFFNLVKTADLFRFSGRFKEIVVFIDCCRQMKSFTAPGIPVRLDLKGPPATHFYCFACALGESAIERNYGGQWQGEFSFQLLKALRGEVGSALDYQGRVTAFTLSQHLSARLRGHDYLPRENQPLRDLVLAKGFSQQNRTLEVILSDPTADIGVLDGTSYKPLDWKCTRSPSQSILVERQEQHLIVITVPRVMNINEAVIREIATPDTNVLKLHNKANGNA